MNNIELLKFECLTDEENNNIILIPTHSLVSPRFMLKNNNLYIFLFDFTKCYLLENIPSDFIDSIKYHKLFLKEKLTKFPDSKILINLK